MSTGVDRVLQGVLGMCTGSDRGVEGMKLKTQGKTGDFHTDRSFQSK